jgi:uncharacterized protein YegL
MATKKKAEPKTKKVEIVCILDRSGSMHAMKEEAIGGFNDFLEKQQELPGKARLTVCLFDHEYELLYNGLDLKKAKPIDDTTYVPRGTTALRDAIGRTVDTVRARIKKTRKDRRPDKVILSILTDGRENASKDYAPNVIKEMLETCQKEEDWDIFYLAANQDAIAVGHGYGITPNCSYNYSSAVKGSTRGIISTMNSNVTRSRTK